MGFVDRFVDGLFSILGYMLFLVWCWEFLCVYVIVLFVLEVFVWKGICFFRNGGVMVVEGVEVNGEGVGKVF